MNQPLNVVPYRDRGREPVLALDVTCPVHGTCRFPPDSTEVHVFAREHATHQPPQDRSTSKPRPKSRRSPALQIQGGATASEPR